MVPVNTTYRTVAKLGHGLLPVTSYELALSGICTIALAAVLPVMFALALAALVLVALWGIRKWWWGRRDWWLLAWERLAYRRAASMLEHDTRYKPYGGNHA